MNETYYDKYETYVQLAPLSNNDFELLHNMGRECADWEICPVYDNDNVLVRTSDVLADKVYFKREADLTLFLLRRT